eukprot:EG_transcript_39903
MNFFFGLNLEPQKVYNQTPPQGSLLHVTQAALAATPQSGRVILKASVDNGPWYVVGTLNPGVVDQFAFDLMFSAGSSVRFTTEGALSRVHLTGYYEACEDVEDPSGAEADHEDEDEEEEGEEGEEEAEEDAEDEEEDDEEEDEEEEEEEVPPPPKK